MKTKEKESKYSMISIRSLDSWKVATITPIGWFRSISKGLFYTKVENSTSEFGPLLFPTKTFCIATRATSEQVVLITTPRKLMLVCI